MSVDSALSSYALRNSVANKAEVAFEAYMKEKKLKLNRLGFDEKNGRVPFFWNLPVALRSLPDYVVSKPKATVYFHVKGTNKLKLNDFVNARLFEEMLCGNGHVVFAFLFGDMNPIFQTVKQVQEGLTGLTLEAFANDGNQYFSLNLKGGVEQCQEKEIEGLKLIGLS